MIINRYNQKDEKFWKIIFASILKFLRLLHTYKLSILKSVVFADHLSLFNLFIVVSYMVLFNYGLNIGKYVGNV